VASLRPLTAAKHVHQPPSGLVASTDPFSWQGRHHEKELIAGCRTGLHPVPTSASAFGTRPETG